MRSFALLSLLACVWLASAGSASAQEAAVLRGLDKVTGAAKDFIAPVDKPVAFGSLQITARACRQRPPEETPETSVYLEIWDAKRRTAEDGAKNAGSMVFRGWMFASSPALNALEHPTYDVWVISCKS